MTAAEQAEARRAARVLETALGEALGPPAPGTRTDLNPSLASDGFSPQDAYRFRLMAAHRALWWPMLDAGAPSRAELMARIRG